MLKDKVEIKIALLAVYEALGVEVAETEAQESLLCACDMNVFDCQECVRELLSEGLLEFKRADGDILCGITKSGLMALDQGRDIVADEVLSSVVRRAVRHFDEIHTGRRYASELVGADGGYYVICSLKSDKCTFMETKLFFDSREEAREAYENCKEKPENIFTGIKTLISGKISHLF